MKKSIGRKVAYALAIVFSLSYAITIFVVGKSIQKNNTEIIEKDMNKHAYNLTLYLRQYMKSQDMATTREQFAFHARELGTILSTKFEDRIIVYNAKGTFMYDSVNKDGETPFGVELNGDLPMALEGSSAYTILTGDEQFMVAASVPIIIEDEILGAIRYFYDYRYLATSSEDLFQYIHMSLLVVFSILFICGLILARRITKPIIRLNKATHMIARGQFDHTITIHTNDELEELANNFNMMTDNIKERIKEVEIERDNLIRLHKHRKLFFDNVTHELKTPLTIISGYTQILQTYQEEDPAFLQKNLGHIKEETDRMHQMIMDLLSAAKVESDIDYHFQVFDLSEAMKSSIEAMSVKAQKESVDIQYDIQKDTRVYGDATRIRQAIENLVDNSLKYTKGCTEPHIHVELTRDEEWAQILIEDNGIGIDEEHLQHLFKPFYRVNKTLRESSGLGLYIVRSIIQRHGGNVKVTSRIHEGTKVRLRIPLKFTTCLQVD